MASPQQVPPWERWGRDTGDGSHQPRPGRGRRSRSTRLAISATIFRGPPNSKRKYPHLLAQPLPNSQDR